MSSSNKYPYPIVNIEPLTNSSNSSTSDNKSSKQKPLGYHGTSTSNANSIMNNGFTKQAFAKQGKNGLQPHERGLYTSPDRNVSEGYAINNDGRPGKVLGVSVPEGTPHVLTSTFMNQRGVIRSEMNEANKKFGKGTYSFTGSQDRSNREPETITQFPIAGKAKASQLPENHDHKVQFTHEVTTIDRFYRISAKDLPKIHTLERIESAKPQIFNVKKK
jgi:hypothetical protein